MIKLPKSIKAYGSAEFNQILKQELSSYNLMLLPLQSMTTQGGMVSDKNISLSVFSSTIRKNHLAVKLAVFFDEIVAGCSCGDPIMEIHNNSELILKIDMQTMVAKFELV